MFRERQKKRSKVEKAAVQGTNEWGRTHQSVEVVTSGYTKKSPKRLVICFSNSTTNRGSAVEAWRSQNNSKKGSRSSLAKGATDGTSFCGFKGRQDIFSQRATALGPHLAVRSLSSKTRRLGEYQVPHIPVLLRLFCRSSPMDPVRNSTLSWVSLGSESASPMSKITKFSPL